MYSDRCRWRGVRHGVHQQIDDYLSERNLITEEHDFTSGIEVDRPRWMGRRYIGYRLLDNWYEIDRGQLQRSSLVEAREQQEVLDKPCHARALLADAPHRVVVGLA